MQRNFPVQRNCAVDSFVDVIDNGTYFYPAWKHYGKQVNVVCDRCATRNIPVCIGYGQRDLCLSCVSFLTANFAGPIIDIPYLTCPARDPHSGCACGGMRWER